MPPLQEFRRCVAGLRRSAAYTTALLQLVSNAQGLTVNGAWPKAIELLRAVIASENKAISIRDLLAQALAQMDLKSLVGHPVDPYLGPPFAAYEQMVQRTPGDDGREKLRSSVLAREKLFRRLHFKKMCRVQIGAMRRATGSRRSIPNSIEPAAIQEHTHFEMGVCSKAFVEEFLERVSRCHREELHQGRQLTWDDIRGICWNRWRESMRFPTFTIEVTLYGRVGQLIRDVIQHLLKELGIQVGELGLVGRPAGGGDQALDLEELRRKVDEYKRWVRSKHTKKDQARRFFGMYLHGQRKIKVLTLVFGYLSTQTEMEAEAAQWLAELKKIDDRG